MKVHTTLVVIVIVIVINYISIQIHLPLIKVSLYMIREFFLFKKE